MELMFDRKKNFEERIWFIHHYASWVKKVPNKVWSKQHANFIDSLMLNAKNFGLSSKEYLDMKDAGNQVRKIRMAKTK